MINITTAATYLSKQKCLERFSESRIGLRRFQNSMYPLSSYSNSQPRLLFGHQNKTCESQSHHYSITVWVQTTTWFCCIKPIQHFDDYWTDISFTDDILLYRYNAFIFHVTLSEIIQINFENVNIDFKLLQACEVLICRACLELMKSTVTLAYLLSNKTSTTV